MTGIIRPATAADVAVLLEIERQCFSDHNWQASDFLQDSCVLMEVNGQVAGFLVIHSVYPGANGQPSEREILNVAVTPAFRHLGLARALLEHELRTPAIYFLEVRASNTAARRLYESLGFQEVGRRPQYYQHPEESAIVMRAERC